MKKAQDESNYSRSVMKFMLTDCGRSIKDFSEEIGKTNYALSNKLSRNTLTLTELIDYADRLGCDVILKSRVTGSEYRPGTPSHSE